MGCLLDCAKVVKWSVNTHPSDSVSSPMSCLIETDVKRRAIFTAELDVLKKWVRALRAQEDCREYGFLCCTGLA